MKVKISIKEGVRYLEVADSKINNKSQHDSPIVLAKMTNYANSGCWSFEDYRLKEHLIPNLYLSDNSEHLSDFNDYPEVDKKLILSKLHSYQLSEEEGLFYWRYDGVALNGDIPENDTRRKFTTGEHYPKEACFTFKAAQKKLSEAKTFWNNYHGSLTDEKLKMENIYRQPHHADYFFELSKNKAKYKFR